MAYSSEWIFLNNKAFNAKYKSRYLSGQTSKIRHHFTINTLLKVLNYSVNGNHYYNESDQRCSLFPHYSSWLPTLLPLNNICADILNLQESTVVQNLTVTAEALSPHCYRIPNTWDSLPWLAQDWLV